MYGWVQTTLNYVSMCLNYSKLYINVFILLHVVYRWVQTTQCYVSMCLNYSMSCLMSSNYSMLCINVFILLHVVFRSVQTTLRHVWWVQTTPCLLLCIDVFCRWTSRASAVENTQGSDTEKKLNLNYFCLLETANLPESNYWTLNVVMVLKNNVRSISWIVSALQTMYCVLMVLNNNVSTPSVNVWNERGGNSTTITVVIDCYVLEYYHSSHRLLCIGLLSQ